MAEAEVVEVEKQEQQQLQQSSEEKSGAPRISSFSLSIWPPSQRTRDAVVHQLVETMTESSSVLAKRYGSVPREEALSAARKIEEEAFGIASAEVREGEGVDHDGMAILDVYSKQIGKKTMDFSKERNSAVTAGSDVVASSDSVGGGSVGEESVQSSEASQV